MKGKTYLAASAFIYGIAPMLSKIAYEGGANAMTLTFLRTFLMLPPLFVFMKMRGQSFKISVREFYKIIILGMVGGTLSNVSLYLAYDYIPTGLATTLHFIYPLMIIVVSALVYHEKIKKVQLGAVMLVTAGIFMFVNLRSRASTIGVLLAVLSGVFYSFYVVYLDYSGIDKMDFVKLTFYQMIIMSAGTLVFGAATNTISFSQLTAEGWVFSAIISLIVTAGAIPLFQLGVRYEGASTAGIVSAFEPITTLVMGAAFLGETMTALQIAGGALILIGVTLAEKYA